MVSRTVCKLLFAVVKLPASMVAQAPFVEGKLIVAKSVLPTLNLIDDAAVDL